MRCALCRREFVFEPKENALSLHDVRIQKLADKLSEGGRLRYTVRQLWFAAARSRLPSPGAGYMGCAVALGSAFVIMTFAAAGSLVSSGFSSGGAGIPLAVVAALLGLSFWVLLRVAFRARRSRPVQVPMPQKTFEGMLVGRWGKVHRAAAPQGLVTGVSAPFPVVENPRLALLSPDTDVLACLAANGVPQNLSMTLPGSAEDVPPDIPVLLLHDASPSGIGFAGWARGEFGGRAVGVGLRPRTVMSQEKALRLREKPLSEDEVAALRASPLRLTEDEIAWLARGWWSPLAAVRPAKLLAAVTRAAERAAAAADPAQRGARQVGFLTWPETP